MKRGDVVILILALLLCAAPLLMLLPAPSVPTRAVVRQNGAVLCTLPLKADAEKEILSPDGSGFNLVRVQSGTVCIADADCPDRTCVRMGAISRAREPLVCLPHRLTITLEGAAGSALDAVTR